MTEDKIIIEHTNRLLQETPWSIERFATELLIPKLEKLDIKDKIQINQADEYLRWKTAKGVQVGRILRATMNFPMAWKWAWVNSLPEPYYSNCRKDLLALAGVLDIPVPTISADKCGCATKSNIATMMREFADVIASSAPAQDGVYDANDNKADTEKYTDEIIDVIEVLNRELFAVFQGTGCISSRSRLIVVSKVVD